MPDLISLVKAILIGIFCLGTLVLFLGVEGSRKEGIRTHKVTTTPIPEHLMPKCVRVHEERTRECGSSCSHFDHINRCCWQSGPWGILFAVQEEDLCKLDYKESDGR